MDIDLINQNLAQANLSKTSNKVKADRPDQKAINETRLKEACAGFEAILLHAMFKSMRSSLPGDAVFSESNSMSIYKSMQDQYLAESLSKSNNSVGLKEFLFQQLKKSI